MFLNKFYQPIQLNQQNNLINPFWQEQLVRAEAIRSSSSPHHRARAAALAQRGQQSSAIAILDPSRRMSTPKQNSASLNQVSPTTPNAHPSASNVPSNSSDKLSSNSSWMALDLGGMQLKSLSPSLFTYQFITNLFINHNNLTFIPPEIYKLNQLVLLDLSGNNLSSLPAELGLLSRLRELLLFDNNLVSIPSELGTLYQLEFLGIDGNPLAESFRQLIQKEGTPALIAYLRDSCPVSTGPPEREWLAMETDLPSPKEDDPPPETFSLLCYNILCDKYATSQMYGYTPSWALNWDYRKEILLQEIMGFSADIVCLQEVDIEQYEDFFLNQLSQHDYRGVYSQKSRAKTMSENEKKRVDGCATFFKASKYQLIESEVIEFSQVALQRSDFAKTEDMFNRVLTKDNIANVALLENIESGTRLIVANVHIHWNPEFRDVKLVQVAILMDEIEKISKRFSTLPPKLNVQSGKKGPVYTDMSKIPLIVCGDFNSVPNSGVYEFLGKGYVDRNHEDFMEHQYGAFTTEGMRHKFALKSSYANIGELPMTNYIPGFEEVIDYVWYTQNTLSVIGLLGEVDQSYLNKIVGFPNVHFPSDHLSLFTEFRLRPPSHITDVSRQNNLDDLESAKLWKGIFYCFWMSDKPLVQQKLAWDLSNILLEIPDVDNCWNFYKGFWDELIREWSGLDRYRLDKYYMLIRKFLQAAIKVCVNDNFNSLDTFNSILLNPRGASPLAYEDHRVPASLTYHMSDIFTDELNKALADTDESYEIPLAQLLKPWSQLLAHTRNNVAYKRVFEGVITKLIDEDDEDIENIRKCVNLKEARKLISNILFEEASKSSANPTNRRKLYEFVDELRMEDD
ncbi:glucose-repressible alcohol dehydrogenase transcriptional effector [Wallemia mellicola]|uniref:CCR4-Not complex 3'-5'-exoribonuclease subunit Ccr4 n=1 Tax=Wallemia mellicola TaxID=1708541 RepID=A0A4T0MDW0_9BASI|nr:glucose-repressible alcohol dehydrogenase transcriptional effector [Wallemia mellicola]